jgi:hypothetical protein
MNRLMAGLVLACVCLPASAAKKPEPTPAERAATHGYLRATLPQWEFAAEFRVTSIQGKKKETFVPDLKERAGLASWGGWIAAGEYQITGILGADGKPYAPIVIRAGELTDLGMLLRVPVGGYEYMLVPLDTADSERDAEQARATLAPLLKSQDFIRWRPTELPQTARFTEKNTGLGLIADLLIAHDRKVNKPPLGKSLKETRDLQGFLALAKSTMPPRAEEAGVDSEGNLYYGADLGQIRVRDTAGNWSHRDTGTYLEISAVEASGQALVAGNLRGQLLASADGGASWRLAHALDPGLAVLDIDRAGSRWFVLAAPFIDMPAPLGFVAAPPGTPRGWNLRDKLLIYSGTSDDFSDLALLKEVTMAPLWGAHWRGACDPVAGHVVGGTYLVNTIPGIQRLDLATMTWSMATDPGHRIDTVRLSADGSIMTVKRQQGAFSKISTSTDLGNSWTPQSRPPYIIYDAAFETADSGEATRWNMNAFGVVLEFYRYDPKVKDWRKAYESPAGCVQMLRDANFAQRFCLTSGGSVLARKDDAWVAEFALE